MIDPRPRAAAAGAAVGVGAHTHLPAADWREQAEWVWGRNQEAFFRRKMKSENDILRWKSFRVDWICSPLVTNNKQEKGYEKGSIPRAGAHRALLRWRHPARKCYDDEQEQRRAGWKSKSQLYGEKSNSFSPRRWNDNRVTSGSSRLRSPEEEETSSSQEAPHRDWEETEAWRLRGATVSEWFHRYFIRFFWIYAFWNYGPGCLEQALMNRSERRFPRL